MSLEQEITALEAELEAYERAKPSGMDYPTFKLWNKGVTSLKGKITRRQRKLDDPLEDYTPGTLWYVMGDAQDEVTVIKACQKLVRVDGYYHDHILINPIYLYRTPCTPQIITDMMQCQKEKFARINKKKKLYS